MAPRETPLALTALGALVAGCGGGAAPPANPAAPVATPSSAPVATPAAPVAPPAAPRFAYPPTRRDEVVDTLHGVAVRDPYRWLEDATRPEVAAWMTSQDAFTRAELAKLPGRDALAARLAEVFYFDEASAPRQRGRRTFFTRKRHGQEKSVLYWKEGERGAERALLDPNAWSTDGSAGLRGYFPSDDGRHVAYKRSEHNADEATLYVIDVATGKVLPGAIPGAKYGDVAWAPDGKGFYYVWIPEPGPAVPVADRPGFAELRFHALGADPTKDITVRPATRDPQTFLEGDVSHDGHWLFVTVEHGWNSTDLYFQDLRAPRRAWTALIEGAPSTYQVTAYRDTFYVHTDEGAPRGRVFAVDPKRPARAAWREIVPESDATLEKMNVLGGRLVLTYLRDAVSVVAIHDLSGKPSHTLALPPLGSASAVIGRATDDTAYVEYTSFTEPRTIYRAALSTGALTPWARVELPIDTSMLAAEQVRYPSKDGTQITMFLVHRKDAVKNGKTPTYLTGYGGFNQSILPGFVSSRSSWAAHAVWIEHGGLVAVPNLRGGGEYGERWHKAGMLLAKQNVFDDFIAAARYLQSSGWTSPEHLAISGGSNGGLLVGAALTQAPELFRAVVCEVPLLDMVRYHLFGSGKTWIPEYGSADDRAQFAALYAYSPYHHVAQGTRYPAVLFSSTAHDDRVDPLHARKLAAQLQWASRGDAPILLRIQANAGHSGADQVKQKIEMNADSYAFLMAQLGMK